MPERLTVCGDPLASSEIERVPVLAPVVDGLNVTLNVQLADGAKVVPHVVVLAKSPETEVDAIFNVAVPLFVSVTTWPALVVPTT